MSTPKPSRRSLPEGRWLWRRLYVFASSGAAWLPLEKFAGRLPGEAVVPMVQGLLGLLGLTMILYLVAPTAQQLGASLGHLLGRGGRR